ncbi:hypothetical protein NDU88_001945 [Pleurodeles waltl]|uniref:Uncharacterized protein n=1 Tax=Pleurodeles waltl TaxID=8319 RepID=A0AAV7MMY2_PLEWA|nr:hypothetical protein NDU88_001945 [Pleurodeles waltl]
MARKSAFRPGGGKPGGSPPNCGHPWGYLAAQQWPWSEPRRSRRENGDRPWSRGGAAERRGAAREAAWAERRAFPQQTGELGAGGLGGIGDSLWATGVTGPRSGPRPSDV